MSVSSLRRFALLLLIAVASFAILQCTCNQRTPVFTGAGCPTTTYLKSNPSICVMSDLTASPSPAPVYDVAPDARNMRTSTPVTINWYAQSGGPLQVTMETAGCTTPVRCDGGHCSANVMMQTLRESESKVCHYSVTLGYQKADPDIVITPCCY
jgi:hypothetical protein